MTCLEELWPAIKPATMFPHLSWVFQQGSKKLNNEMRISKSLQLEISITILFLIRVMFCCIWYCLLLCTCFFSFIKWGWICFAFVHTHTHKHTHILMSRLGSVCAVIVNCCCPLTWWFLSLAGSPLRYTVFACNRKASAPLQRCKIQHLCIPGSPKCLLSFIFVCLQAPSQPC